MTEDTGSRALLSDPTRRTDGLIAKMSMTTQPDPARTAITPEELLRDLGTLAAERGMAIIGGETRELADGTLLCIEHVFATQLHDLLRDWRDGITREAGIRVEHAGAVRALAASEARLAEVERENARLAPIEAEVRSIVADINDGKADAYWVRLAKIAMPDLGFPSWNDLHPAAHSAGEEAE